MPRQSQNQSSAPSRKKALLSVAILLALTGVLILLFQDHWAEISAALAQLSLGQVALVLALGITYPLLEGVASWLIAAACPALPCGTASTTHGWARLAMSSVWGPERCPCRPTTCTAAGWGLAPAWG